MIIKGNFIYAPSLEKLEIREQQYLLTEDGKVKGFHKTLPEEFTDRKVTDYGQAVIIPAFNDLHIHAPQYVNRGVGFDRELLPWLETYTFPVEVKYAEKAFAEKGYRLFLRSLWEAGTMRFSAFATLHKEASWHLMEPLRGIGTARIYRQGQYGQKRSGLFDRGYGQIPCRYRRISCKMCGRTEVCPLYCHTSFRAFRDGETDGRFGMSGGEI